MLKRILFYGDFSESSDRAFTYAFDLAKTYHAKLFIFHVTRDLVYPEQYLLYLPPNILEELKASRKEEISQKLRILYLQKMDEFRDYEIVWSEGIAFREIILAAEKESVDVIVIGTRRKKGIVDVLFGSTSEKVAKTSPCPVLIVRTPGERFVIS